MAKVVREDIDDLNAVLKVDLSREHYEPKLKSELNKYRKKAHIKGFRKGKTPMGFIKKMYGTAVLAEVINDSLQSAVTGYISDEKLNILGQPLPVEKDEELEFDVNDLKDYSFAFELGMAPEFELEGIDSGSEFERYAVEITESRVDEDLMGLQKRVGTQEPVEGAIEENDLITLNAEELDGDAAKENGWASTFDILVRLISSEELKNEVLGKTKGDKIRFNIFELEKDRDEEYVRKYFLNVGEEDADREIGAEFEAEITEIKRVVPAELNQEFFDKAFGEGAINSGEEARQKIEEDLKTYYERQAENLLYRDFRDHLMEVNQISLPDDFLRRWLVASNENVTEEAISKEYDAFAENLKWSLIRGKAVRKLELQVDDNEIFEGFKDRVRGYFGGYGDELIILNTANRLMEDQQQVDQMYQELISEKLFKAIAEVVTIADKGTTIEAFDDLIQAAREAMENQTAPANDDSGDSAEPTEEEVTEDVG